MLVFSRKSHESVVVGGPADLERILQVTVVEVRGGRVKLGFDVLDDAPEPDWEVWQRVRSDVRPHRSAESLFPQPVYRAAIKLVRG